MVNSVIIEKLKEIVKENESKWNDAQDYANVIIKGKTLSSLSAKERDDYAFQKGVAKGMSRANYGIEELIEFLEKN